MNSGKSAESTEENLRMTANPRYDPCPSRILGQAMLDAWLCGDRPRLSRKLQDARSFPFPVALGVERDRLEVLKALASEMSLSDNLFASRAADPRLGSWIDLLDHLASSGGD